MIPVSDEKFGLNGYLESVKGAGLRFKIKALGWALREAWLRAWRGYDDGDICSIGYRFAPKMTVILKEFKNRNQSLLYDNELDRILDENETDQVIDDLIFYFENSCDDVVATKVIGHVWNGAESWDEIQKVHAEQDRCLREAMKLFSKWCFHLWT